MKAEEYAANPVPSIQDWEDLWAAWDAVTQRMIPEEELLGKPIKLRNACIFYLGHIPTFMDIHLTRATRGKPTEPSHYPKIFERGIDPDVDNPEQCHSHSEIPDSWPPASEILGFQNRVRMRTKKQYESGQHKDQRIGRALWIGYEHEMMHLETLLYMLVQSEKTLPPPNTIRPDFETMAQQAKRSTVLNKWLDIPAQDITIGIEDSDDNSGPEHFFGWDIERVPRTVHVKAFSAQGRPITNGEYAAYLESTGKQSLPASWASIDHPDEMDGNEAKPSSPSSAFLQGKAVRTVYGLIPLRFALDWPVSASYDELKPCALYMGGRIPTMEEARSIYKYVEEMKKKEAENVSGRTIPAVNG